MDNSLKSKQMASRITPQESKVLQLVVDGYTSKEIAIKLVISVRTVEVHRKNLFVKMGVDNAVKLVRLALEFNLAK